MKKRILSLFLFLFIGLFAAIGLGNTIEINAAQSTTMNITDASKDSTAPSEPNYADVEKHYTPLKRVTNGNDWYEENDSMKTATTLYPEDYYAYNSYKSTVIAYLDDTLKYSSASSDIDYYRINGFADGKVKLEISILEGTGKYKVEVLKVKTVKESSNNLITQTVTLLNLTTNTPYYTYTFDFKAGSYYIKVSSNKTISNFDLKYQLTTTYLSDYPDNEYIDDLRYNKGLGGALWIADYNPYEGSKTGFESDAKYVQMTGSSNINELPRITLSFNKCSLMSDEMAYFTNGEEIPYLELYVWDVNTKKIISELASINTEELIKEVKKANDKNAKLSTACDITKGIITIGGFVLNKTFFEGSGKVFTVAGKKIVEKIFNTFATDVDSLEKTLEALKVLAYAIGYNENVDGTNVFDGKVLHFKVWYTIKNGVISFGTTLSKESIDEYKGNYTSNIIYSKNGFYTGKIYGLPKFESLGNQLNFNNEKFGLKEANLYANITPNIQTIKVGSSPVPRTYNMGEALWVSFKCEKTGNYTLYFYADPTLPGNKSNIKLFTTAPKLLTVKTGYKKTTTNNFTYRTLVENKYVTRNGAYLTNYCVAGNTYYYRLSDLNYAYAGTYSCKLEAGTYSGITIKK